MADSDNSRSLSAVTRRRLLSTSAAWLVAQVSALKAASGAEPDGSRGSDPVLALWQEWMTAHDQVGRLCRTQQRLESRLVAAVGFPRVDLIAPDQDHPVPAFTSEEIDRLLGDAPESAEARTQAKAVLAERQRAWDALDERLGYSRAKEAEAAAFMAQENLANALWAEPARSIAGAAAKLHAILSMGDVGGRDEFPWPQIRVVLRDIVRCKKGNVMSDRDHRQAGSCRFYTYAYGDDLTRTSRSFYETQDMARQDVEAFRRELIAEVGRQHPLPDIKIVRIETVPITPKALVDLFNDLDGQLGGFIRSREVVEIVSEPQVKARKRETAR